ncbi:MAG: AbfB domain-containing protein [Bacteroidota bacterium]
MSYFIRTFSLCLYCLYISTALLFFAGLGLSLASAQLQEGATYSLDFYNAPNGYEGYWLSAHVDQQATLQKVDYTQDKKTQFVIHRGLAGTGTISFESVQYPGYYLRHKNFQIVLSKEGDLSFKKDASWKVVPGLADPQLLSFEALNFPKYYLKHGNFEFMMGTVDSKQSSKEEATYDPAFVNDQGKISVGKSFAFDFAFFPDGFQDYWMHATPAQPARLNNGEVDQSQFMVRQGLAGQGTVSFESVEYPGHFLRHSGFNIFLHKKTSDNIFIKDASWKVVPGLVDPSMVSFESLNFPKQYLKHTNFAFVVGKSDQSEFEKKNASFSGRYVARIFVGDVFKEGSKDGKGQSARFRSIRDLTIDPQGNIYVVDRTDATIRKITSDGTVSTIAGQTLQEGSVDGLGQNARFTNPESITIDMEGNLHVAESFREGHNRFDNMPRLREITPDGTVSTRKLHNPLAAVEDMDVDLNGNLVLSTYNKKKFTRISPRGTLGIVDLPQKPSGFHITSDGTIYMYAEDDLRFSQISKISPSGQVTPLTGLKMIGFKDGPASEAQFHDGKGITIDAKGTIYIADRTARIRALSSDGIVRTIAGAKDSGNFGIYCKLAIGPDGKLYVSDNKSIRVITLD